ncbi:MAG: DUF1499 domain-containing protein [Pyrinomonadaceae bacterium]
MLIYFVIVVVVLLTGIFILGRFYPDNIAETAPDGGRKNLKTRIYQTDPATAVKTVKEIIPTLSSYGGNWKIVGESESAEKGKIIKAEIQVVVFTDDLEVYLKETEKGVSIDAKSNSRVGKSDLGENARHINQLLKALDEKLNK